MIAGFLAILYSLPLALLFEGGAKAASAAENLALYGGAAGAFLHFWKRRSQADLRARPFLAFLACAAVLWTGILFSEWTFDGLVHGAYDYTGISSVIASHSRELGLLSSPYYRAANGSEFFLAHHFSPVLALFVPIPYFASTHAWYGIFLAAAFAGGLWLWYRLIRSVTPASPTVFAGLLFVPALYRLGISFHFELLVIPFSALLFLGIRRSSNGLAAAGLLLLLALKEDLAVYCTLFGISLLFDPGRRRAGLWIASVSAAVFLLAAQIVLPALSGEEHSRFLSYWQSGTMTELLRTVPHGAERLLANWRLPYEALLACAFLPLFRPAIFFCVLLPVFTVHSLSNHPIFHTADSYYMYTYLPWLLFGLLEGLERGGARLHWAPGRAHAFLACVFLAFAAYQARAKKDMPWTAMPDRSQGRALREFLSRELVVGRTLHTHAFLSAQAPLDNPVRSLADRGPADYLLLEEGRPQAQDETEADLARMKAAAAGGILKASLGPYRLYSLSGKN